MTPPFEVTGVWADGVQRKLSDHDDLAEALRERDRKARSTGFPPVFLVHDADDPERGYFDWDDVEDAT